MVRPAYFDRNGIKRGVWSKEEDEKLSACINRFDHAKVPNWRLLPLVAGLKRCGKSCRLRWMNYLKPGLKRGNFAKDEENRIIELHKHLPNKWSAIAAYFPGRTDNDIKNYWNGHIKKRRRNGAIKNQTLHENSEQSFDSSSCITTSLNSSSSEVNVFDQGLFPAENIGAVESNADSDYNAANYLCHNFLEEEFDIMSLLFEFSCNSSAAKGFDFLAEPVGEDFFNLPF